MLTCRGIIDDALFYNIWRSRNLLAASHWPLVLAAGRWPLAAGRWSLVAGRWPLFVSFHGPPSLTQQPITPLTTISNKCSNICLNIPPRGKPDLQRSTAYSLKRIANSQQPPFRP
jgi:hypothetical protein